MKIIKKIEKVTSVFPAWKPSDVAFIKALEWSNNNLVIIFYCQLRSDFNEWPDMSKDFFEVKINFSKVSSLKLDFSSAGLHQVSGFDILDASDKGLEKINFQIEDYENDSIYFFCEEVEITEVSDPERIVVF